jgi:hypothetical protein
VGKCVDDLSLGGLRQGDQPHSSHTCHDCVRIKPMLD